MAKHIGRWAHRLNKEANNPREAVFAEKWQKENDIHAVLDHLACGAPAKNPDWVNLGTERVRNITPDEIATAATVVQWLGSNVGWSFLRECVDACGFQIVRKEAAR